MVAARVRDLSSSSSSSLSSSPSREARHGGPTLANPERLECTAGAQQLPDPPAQPARRPTRARLRLWSKVTRRLSQALRRAAVLPCPLTQPLISRRTRRCFWPRRPPPLHPTPPPGCEDSRTGASRGITSQQSPLSDSRSASVSTDDVAVQPTTRRPAPPPLLPPFLSAAIRTLLLPPLLLLLLPTTPSPHAVDRQPLCSAPVLLLLSPGGAFPSPDPSASVSRRRAGQLPVVRSTLLNAALRGRLAPPAPAASTTPPSRALLPPPSPTPSRHHGGQNDSVQAGRAGRRRRGQDGPDHPGTAPLHTPV